MIQTPLHYSTRTSPWLAAQQGRGMGLLCGGENLVLAKRRGPWRASVSAQLICSDVWLVGSGEQFVFAESAALLVSPSYRIGLRKGWNGGKRRTPCRAGVQRGRGRVLEPERKKKQRCFRVVIWVCMKRELVRRPTASPTAERHNVSRTAMQTHAARTRLPAAEQARQTRT